MNNIENSRERNIDEIILIVKLASLLFCGIIVYKVFFTKARYAFRYENMVSIGFLIFILIAIYWIWAVFSNAAIQSKHKRMMQIIENFAFIFIFSTLIFISNQYVVEYRFLFLFIIITSTLQLGMKQGMSMASISSVVILAIDLISFPNIAGVNPYFENDLITVGVFILTAWPLGHYVEIEKANLRRKNLQIKELGNELKKQNKQRKDIEEKLLRNEACYNLLIENSRDAIFVHRDSKLIFANESAAKLLGVTCSDELIDRSIFDMMPINERDEMKKKFEQVL